jgi:molecular chaperone Hsp33
VQLKAPGPLRILFTECTGDGRVRGIASWHGRVDGQLDVADLGGGAMLAITIERTAQQQRHQGIVPLEGHTLAGAFEAYFTRSEQLPTLIHLVCRDEVCAGMMIQQVPSVGGHALRESSSEFERVGALFGTLTDVELIDLSAENLLRRLFHADDVRLHGAQALAFGCRCSRERVASVLLTLGHDEALAARSGEGSVEVRCEFCNRNYRFDAIDLAELFARESAAPGTPTTH